MTQQQPKQLLTAAGLMAASPATADVECQAWGGIVRLARLSPAAKLEFALAAGQLIKDEDGVTKMLEPANWDFAVRILAGSIVGEDGVLQFADPTAHAWLAGELEAISELLPAVLRLNRLGTADRNADQEEAKKN